jgi:hypothetical protein
VAYDRMKSAMQQFRFKRLKEDQQIILKKEAKSAAPHTMGNYFILLCLLQCFLSSHFLLVRLGELELFILASISKILASVITYPHEVIRTRIREERGVNNRYTGVVSGIARIGREEGLK